MIRHAVSADKNRVIQLLADSRVGAGFASGDGFTFPFDPAYAARLFVHHTASAHAACFVHDVNGTAQGVLMAIAFDHPFGPVKMAKETLWWIDPGHRGGTAALRMLDAFETWARDRKCAFCSMVGIGGDPAVSRMYERRGYRAAEVHHLKTL